MFKSDDNLILLIIWILNLSIFCVDLSAGLNYCLNTNVIPDAYEIYLKLYMEAKDGERQNTFDGMVNITLHTNEPRVHDIELHKKYLEITKVSLSHDKTGKVLKSFGGGVFVHDTFKQIFRFDEPLLPKENYTLQIFYNGRMRNDRAGIFRLDYLDSHGKLKTLVTTQAKLTEARSIVPCFDEPNFKAKFRLSLNYPHQYTSMSNTLSVFSQTINESNGKRCIDNYDWTPKMSSYLLAFIVCEYEKPPPNFDIIFSTRREIKEQTTFSQDIASLIKHKFDEYTQQPYGLLGNDILHEIGIPDFLQDGLENWGLVLYDEEILTQVRDYTDGWRHKQKTIAIITHETAHQWFGNSVTVAWWSSFWLSEGFANYFQYFMAHQQFPQYQFDQQFVLEQVHEIFEIDALNKTQPLTTVENFVQSPLEIAGKSSDIAYKKGAAILHMFRNLMGDLNFDNAVRQYLRQFQLKNVTPNDLFIILKQHWPQLPPVNLDTFYNDWTEKVGYPILFVDDFDDFELQLRQQRFLLDKNDGSDGKLRYTIPLTYTTNVERDFENLLPKSYFFIKLNTLIIRFNQPIKWCIFNLQQANYYRVFYSTRILTAIKQALMAPAYSGIHVLNRAQIIDDLFNFANADLIDYSEVLEFAKYLAFEVEYPPWHAAFKGLEKIAKRLNLQQQQSFGKFILNITNKVYEKLGFENQNDTVLDVYNRNAVIYWTCKYGNANCNFKAQAILKASNVADIKPCVDFREKLYCSAVRFGNFSSYRILYNWYMRENHSSEQQLLLRAMGCTKDFAQFHFSRIFKNDFPATQTAMILRSLYAENPENVSPIYFAIIARYKLLQERLGGWSELAAVLADIADFFTTNEQLEHLKKFIATHITEFGSDIKTLQNAEKNVEKNLNWAADRLNSFNYNITNFSSAATLQTIFWNLFILSFIVTCLV